MPIIIPNIMGQVNTTALPIDRNTTRLLIDAKLYLPDIVEWNSEPERKGEAFTGPPEMKVIATVYDIENLATVKDGALPQNKALATHSLTLIPEDLEEVHQLGVPTGLPLWMRMAMRWLHELNPEAFSEMEYIGRRSMGYIDVHGLEPGKPYIIQVSGYAMITVPEDEVQALTLVGDPEAEPGDVIKVLITSDEIPIMAGESVNRISSILNTHTNGLLRLLGVDAHE